MPNIDLQSDAKSQFATTMCAKEPNIVLDIVPVLDQHGHCDCGIFAIAFVTSLCAGHNPVENTYV